MARPSLKFTAAHRQAVAVSAAGGMAHEEIALALGIARNTLEKHFEKELSVGAHQRRMEVLVAQYRAAKKGNVAAQKAFLANEPRLAVPPMPKPDTGAPAGAAGAAPQPGKKLGKKEQAALDAQTAGADSDWGQLLRPKDATVQ